MISLYRLPHGQYGYNGHVINLPQDVESFVNRLPRHPNDLDIIVVRQQNSSESHHDFRVRRSKVVGALQWLLTNNIYFRNITTDDDIILSLPENGDLIHVPTVTFPLDETDEPDPSTNPEDPYTADLSRTFVPGVYQSRTESQPVRQSLENFVMWPNREQNPINEFSMEGYFSRAFPTLFPTGAAEFLAPRIHKITIGNYFKHLIMYDDKRFAKHCRFRYFALNTEMRWRALQTGRIYVRQNPEDGQLCVDELQDMVGRDGENFSNHVLHYASSLRGTRQYWMQQRRRLISMVDVLGTPTIFFTHSAADFQWPGLGNLICYQGGRQREAVIENPAIADWFFFHRIERFVQLFYVDILGASDMADAHLG